LFTYVSVEIAASIFRFISDEHQRCEHLKIQKSKQNNNNNINNNIVFFLNEYAIFRQLEISYSVRKGTQIEDTQEQGSEENICGEYHRRTEEIK
jgi:hypothetical protein